MTIAVGGNEKNLAAFAASAHFLNPLRGIQYPLLL